ncbi:hypothetical protein BJV82DRAFT_715863 [Fennellomyces sp. T-0311]|nr:hypothetical protein BJV82DRAFT_715863 [Fennellomyces sp. T-0311]
MEFGVISNRGKVVVQAPFHWIYKASSVLQAHIFVFLFYFITGTQTTAILIPVHQWVEDDPSAEHSSSNAFDYQTKEIANCGTVYPPNLQHFGERNFPSCICGSSKARIAFITS